ncbi:hypothetical protein ACKWTF_010250 [Chironomus riparius]
MILLCIIFLLGAFYLLNIYIFNYWKRRNIPQAEGQKILVGDASTMFLRKECLGEFFQTMYNKYKHHKFIGAYLSYRPVLIVNDPELIQDIMIRNFTSFHDRPVPINEEVDPLTKNLFFIKGQKWRDLRVKMSPTFTSGKLKLMFSIMTDCGKVLQDYIEKNLQENKNVFEFRDLLARFTTNIISSVAFGIDNDCINEPDNIFRKMGMKIFDQGIVQGMKNVIGLLTPAFFVKLNISLFHRDIYDFIVSLVHQTIEYREKNNFHRNDFMQLLIELKNQGYISVDKNSKDEDEIEWKFEDSNGHEMKNLTIEDIAAQVFVFFAAGFETSSSTMQLCLYELCKNQNIQRKVQQEIDQVMKSSESKEITYDLLHQLKYLECCVDETLRKYPIIPIHFRESTKDYKIPNTDIVIDKGTAIYISLMGIQRDPDIYEDPMAFKPERFLNSTTGSPKVTKGLVYTPFGDGPRKCIGARMGKFQTLLGLYLLMSKYNVSFADESLGKEELRYHASSLVLTPLEKFNFKVTAR